MHKLISKVAAYISNKTWSVPAILYSDNAKEYPQRSVIKEQTNRGVTSKTSPPYQPQSNGFAERIKWTIVNAARATLFHTQFDASYWSHAVCNAMFKYIIIPQKATKQPPLTALFKWSFKSGPMFIFGQVGFVSEHGREEKLYKRGCITRYLYGVDESYIGVEVAPGRLALLAVPITPIIPRAMILHIQFTTHSLHIPVPLPRLNDLLKPQTCTWCSDDGKSAGKKSYINSIQ